MIGAIDPGSVPIPYVLDVIIVVFGLVIVLMSLFELRLEKRDRGERLR